jgi:hypothetical protein
MALLVKRILAFLPTVRGIGVGGLQVFGGGMGAACVVLQHPSFSHNAAAKEVMEGYFVQLLASPLANISWKSYTAENE